MGDKPPPSPFLAILYPWGGLITPLGAWVGKVSPYRPQGGGGGAPRHQIAGWDLKIKTLNYLSTNCLSEANRLIAREFERRHISALYRKQLVFFSFVGNICLGFDWLLFGYFHIFGMYCNCQLCCICLPGGVAWYILFIIMPFHPCICLGPSGDHGTPHATVT